MRAAYRATPLNGAAGELWRSRFDAERNLIVVNMGIAIFVFATRSARSSCVTCAALCQGLVLKTLLASRRTSGGTHDWLSCMSREIEVHVRVGAETQPE